MKKKSSTIIRKKKEELATVQNLMQSKDEKILELEAEISKWKKITETKRKNKIA